MFKFKRQLLLISSFLLFTNPLLASPNELQAVGTSKVKAFFARIYDATLKSPDGRYQANFCMHYRLQWLCRLGIFLILISTFGLGSCSSMSINSVTTTNPSLQLEDYFKGKTRAYGVLLDRSGVATRYFNVDIIGTWVAETQTLTLDERFIFNDGEKSQRIWTITKQAADRYSGQAADVVGTAQGTVKGNVLNWQYVLQVPYKGSTINVNFDDWMYLMSDKVLLNKAIMSKWGFKVGEVVITFEKL